MKTNDDMKKLANKITMKTENALSGQMQNLVILSNNATDNTSRGKPKLFTDKFTCCEELFPNWLTARTILSSFLLQIRDKSVSACGDHINIYHGCPLLTSNGETIEMWESFPPEDREQVKGIFFKVCLEYTPNLSNFSGKQVTPDISDKILHVIDCYEQSHITVGNGAFIDRLYFLYGIKI